MNINQVTLVGTAEKINLQIRQGMIQDISACPFSDLQSPEPILGDAIIFPGLINSHDHLDFDLFPALGSRTYHDYVEWGQSIHQAYPKEIAAVLKVPTALRERWGSYKNLLCGVTTVVHHGKKLSAQPALLSVMEKAQSIHSIQLEKHWKRQLNHPFRRSVPVAIHIGEGTNEMAKREIDQLIRWNIFRRDLIGIHGVALSQEQARHFKGLIWCPESNVFLLGQTATIRQLKKQLPVVFGSDSTLTGSWNIWEQLRLARSLGLLSDEELYRSITSEAASLWSLNKGILAKTMDADLVVARNKGHKNSLDAFFDLQPEDLLLVMHRGDLLLIDAEIPFKQGSPDKQAFSNIRMGTRNKYVKGDLPALSKAIQSYYPGALFPFSLERPTSIPCF